MKRSASNKWRSESVRNLEWHDEEDPIPHKVLRGDVKINITPKEQQIFDFFLAVNEHYKLGTTLRVAGGWVRNKLIGREAHDIDFALDNMNGTDFAKYVVSYQQLKGMPTKAIGTIMPNAEKSKHLETATTHVFGEAIDLVNLRSETYADDSRIPTEMKLGTPEEDAYRRDLTINALFYNINTQQVEDFTGKGIEDLRNGRIRTPLAPLATFLDDPLRLIRSIRFACEFHFVVDDSIIEAAHDAALQKALAGKVSRERVGVELFKILKGPDPVGGFALIHEMRLLSAIFTRCAYDKRDKKEYVNPQPIEWDEEKWKSSLSRMRKMYKASLRSHFADDDRVALLFAAFLSPVAPIESTREQLNEWVQGLVVCSLRLPAKLSNNITHILTCAKDIEPLVEAPTTAEDVASTQSLVTHFSELLSKERIRIGNWLRNAGGLWEHSMLLSEHLDLINDYHLERQESKHEPATAASASASASPTGTSDNANEYNSTATHANNNNNNSSSSSNAVVDTAVPQKTKKHHAPSLAEAFIAAIKAENEHTRTQSLKPVLKGNDIAKLLGIKPGPSVGAIINEMINWQIASVAPKTVPEAQQWLADNKQKLLDHQ